MWSDNETELDLLGFDFLVDELVVALTEPRLLPLTIGIVGDWGSGKSSLMRMTEAELEKVGADTYRCVRFSPWRFEDYADVKVALMTAVLDALCPVAGNDDEIAAEIGRLQAAARGLTRVGRLFARGGIRAVPTVASAGATALGVPSDLAPVLLAGSTELATAAAHRLEESDVEQEANGDGPVDLATFHDRFEALIESLPDLKALVVFVDDLDRCLPDTIVDTFEAVRLFLNAPKTAFVVALNRRVVEDAINRQYPNVAGPNDTIGHDYLEKMLQLTVTVPPLSELDAETYLNLLLCETGLGPEELTAVHDEARKRRRDGELAVSMNYGIAKDVVDIPSDLQRMFAWVNSTAGVLVKGLRGNPRLLKRFLNTMELRVRAAKRRNVELKQPELAKLMVLEELWLAHFERLFRWQLEAEGGKPARLATAEALARGEGTGEAPDEEVAQWVAEPAIAEWLAMDPELGGVDLRPYFSFARDRISASPAARLPGHVQAILTRLRSAAGPTRNKAVQEATSLSELELSELWEAIDDLVRRKPDDPALLAGIHLASEKPALVPRLHATLSAIPPQAIKPLVALEMMQRFAKAMPDELKALLESWSAAGPTAVGSVIAKASQAGARRRGRQ